MATHVHNFSDSV